MHMICSYSPFDTLAVFLRRWVFASKSSSFQPALVLQPRIHYLAKTAREDKVGAGAGMGGVFIEE